jgi:hypothetical protein
MDFSLKKQGGNPLRVVFKNRRWQTDKFSQIGFVANRNNTKWGASLDGMCHGDSKNSAMTKSLPQ